MRAVRALWCKRDQWVPLPLLAVVALIFCYFALSDVAGALLPSTGAGEYADVFRQMQRHAPLYVTLIAAALCWPGVSRALHQRSRIPAATVADRVRETRGIGLLLSGLPGLVGGEEHCRSGRRRKRAAACVYGGAFVLVALWNSVVGRLVEGLGGEVAAASGADLIFSSLPQWSAYALYSVAVVPLLEEVFFRGLIYGSLRRFGILPATVTSAGVFGLAHGIAGSYALVASGLGVVCCLFYESTGSLRVPVILHMVNNGAVALVSLLATSIGVYELY